MQGERNPKCWTEARCLSHPDYLQEREPDPDGGDADADGECSDHPTTVMHDVVAPDGPDRKHQAGQEPRPNTTAADASGSPPNVNKPPKINAKTPLIMPAVATTRPSRRWKV